jgi:hypothetical protein
MLLIVVLIAWLAVVMLVVAVCLSSDREGQE